MRVWVGYIDNGHDGCSSPYLCTAYERDARSWRDSKDDEGYGTSAKLLEFDIDIPGRECRWPECSE